MTLILQKENKLTKSLNHLAKQQDEMIKQGNRKQYKKLCRIEAELLKQRAEEVNNKSTKETLLDAADKAMRRALTFDNRTN